MGVSVVIPAYQAAASIGVTVRAVGNLAQVQEIWVVDDGSRDSTAVAARAAGAGVVCLPRNQGKGTALNRAAPLVQGDIVLFLDADLGASAAAAGRLIEAVTGGQADLAVARFPPNQPGGGLGLVKELASRGLYYYTGRHFQAPLSGQRAMKRETMLRLLPFAPGFGVEIAMTIKAFRLGLRVVELEVPMTHRVTGRNLAGFYHRGRQFVHVIRALAGELNGSRG